MDISKKVICVAAMSLSLVCPVSTAFAAADPIPVSADNVQQTKIKVSGKITDASGQTVIGASVVQKGTDNGTITDLDGKYTISVPSDAVLTVSCIGYKTADVAVNGQAAINITMQDDDKLLDEVVIVGYGTQKKVNLTGAVESVGAEEIANRPTANLTQSLEGAVPNLTISLADGKPTRSSSYQVRGTSSIGQGGSALVLIDGVEGDPSTINPNDVENVTVLKDAAAAAIYGARGSFGVILITTKNPEKGRTQVTYSGNFLVKAPTMLPDLIDDSYEYSKHFILANQNWNGAYPSSVHSIIPFSEMYYNELANHRKGAGKDETVTGSNGKYTYYHNTDWYDELYKDCFYGQEHNVSVQGGSEKVKFMISGRYYGQDGIYEANADNYNSYNMRAKGSVQVTKWLNVGNNFEFTKIKYYNPLLNSSYGTVWHAIDNAAPIMSPMFNPDGTLTRAAAAGVGGLLYGYSWQKQNTEKLRNTTDFTASFFDNKLKIRGDYSYTINSSEVDTKMYPTKYSEQEGVMQTMGSRNFFAEQLSKTQYQAANIYAEYSQKFNDAHDIKLMAGYNYETSLIKSNTMKKDNLLYATAESMALANGEVTATEAYSRWRIAGGFFRVNYNYKERYLLELNGRYDGSSKFMNNQQWGFFPSASIGWRIEQEPWFNVSKDVITNLKLRASYGSLGNGNIAPYTFQEKFTVQKQNRYAEGVIQSYVSVPAAIPSSLTWESATTANFGIDAGFASGRLNFTGDYYIRKTTDMYTAGPTLPGTFGAASPKGNYADMTTKGWELSLSWNDSFDMAGKPFNYGISATLGDYQSWIDKFNNDNLLIGNTIYGHPSQYYSGMKVGEIWGFVTEGIFQTEEEVANSPVPSRSIIEPNSLSGKFGVGDLKFKDLNNDGKIDNGEGTVTNPGDRKIIGNFNPRYNYSFRLSGDWNGIYVNAFFQGVGHQDWLTGAENTLFWGLFNKPYVPMTKYVAENYWTEDNRDAYFPKLTSYVGGAYQRQCVISQTRYLQNVAYIRLKNLQIGYTIPERLTQKAKIAKATVYVSMDNLWSWSPLYRHEQSFDVQSINGEDQENVEIINSGWYSNYTMESGESASLTHNYPILKTFSFGLSLTL
ncbi:MAG: TonB-dependent receptor [Bacteroidales bacterium]|nr:TonB-dependent receptor [Candidatus Cryptobacteroides onthequi]